MKINARLSSGKVSSNSVEARSLHEKSRFGEKSRETITYSLQEAFYLVEDKKMQIVDSKEKELDTKDLLKSFSKLDKKFHIKYAVYKDLRKKGYIPKTALKFGAEFRIYDKGSKIEGSHSKWICIPVMENSKISWQDFSAKNRIAHSCNKNLLIAMVDDEDDVTYFEANWKKLN